MEQRNKNKVVTETNHQSVGKLLTQTEQRGSATRGTPASKLAEEVVQTTTANKMLDAILMAFAQRTKSNDLLTAPGRGPSKGPELEGSPVEDLGEGASDSTTSALETRSKRSRADRPGSRESQGPLMSPAWRKLFTNSREAQRKMFTNSLKERLVKCFY